MTQVERDELKERLDDFSRRLNAHVTLGRSEVSLPTCIEHRLMILHGGMIKYRRN